MKIRSIVLVLFGGTLLSCWFSFAQVENVPVNNQVYEFLDRMGVKGILPNYSNAMIPLSRREVADDLLVIDRRRDELSAAEVEFLQKFEQEFSHEIDPSRENATVLLRDGFQGITSEKEKYLYAHTDSTVSAYVEAIGALEHRGISGDSYGSTGTTFDQYGGRIRGTIANRVGYYLQSINGTFYGNRTFALSDPRFRGNVKFNNLNSPYFDYTEAYLRASFDWFDIEFGREYALIGTGYSDRLLLSDNAPVIDLLKLEVHYKSLRYVFLHGSLVGDSTLPPGLVDYPPLGTNKYLALHRLQFSPIGCANIGVSEMMIYQRFSPEFAYLNPIDFYKSAEHSLRDRDNAFLNFDLEVFPLAGCKVYGTWLIDDIDFSKLGTGWWGNEFGWQGGVFAAGVAGIADVDAVLEYTRIEPYVYSNRSAGNDYTNDGIGLGHHLEPNSDEWFIQLDYRPMKQLRTWIAFTHTRHGANIVAPDGTVIRNVGGDVLQGHRSIDSETATFLDGELLREERLQLRAMFEPIRSYLFGAVYEFRQSRSSAIGVGTDNYFAARVQIEY